MADGWTVLFWGSLTINTVQPLVSHSGWVLFFFSISVICDTGHSLREFSFSSQYVWMMSEPGPVRFFIPKSLCLIYTIVVFTGPYLGRLVWSALIVDVLATVHYFYVMPFSSIYLSGVVQFPVLVGWLMCYYSPTRITPHLVQ